MTHSAPQFRTATTAADIAHITDTIVAAFANDPSWQPMLYPNPADHSVARRYWSFFINSAQRYPHSYCNQDGTVAAIWYPPAAQELTPAEEKAFPELATELLGAKKASELFTIVERFEIAKPVGDYYYLSLLGVHPNSRGKGLGMSLVKSNLQEFDRQQIPTYLESSNPANDKRYAALGYRVHGKIVLPAGGEITTMWRDPQSN